MVRRGGYRRVSLAAIAALLLLTCCTSNSLVESVHIQGGDAAVQTGQHYFLPKSVIKVSVWGVSPKNGKWRTDEEKASSFAVIEGDPVVVPDTRYLMRIDNKFSSSSSDIVQIDTDANGLLTKVDASSDDQTGKIFVNLAKIAKGILQVGAAFGAGAKAETGGVLRRDTLVIDPLSDEGRAAFARIRDDYGVHLAIRPLSNCPDVVPLTAQTCAFTETCRRQGVCFRPQLPYVLVIDKAGVRRKKGAGSEVVKVGRLEETLLLTNEAPIFCYPVLRTQFVKRATTLTFTDGILTSARTEKPSQALALATIPIDILKEIVSIPASLLTLRSEVNQKTREVADQELAALKALEELRRYTAELQAARAAAAAPPAPAAPLQPGGPSESSGDEL